MKNMLKEPHQCWHNERYLEHEGLLNLEDAEYLLITIKNVLKAHDVVILPMFGTLLGAIREHGFIKNDTDIDVVIYEKDIQKIFDLIPELEKKGIKLHCYVMPWIFTFEYKGVSCDFYPLYRTVWPWSKHYYLLLEKYISKSFFEKTEDYELFGEIFQIPANSKKLLSYLYGKDWHIPQSKKPKIESRLFFWRYLHRFVARCIRYVKRHIKL